MITGSPTGIGRRLARATLCQSDVEAATRLITATSDAIVITATTLPSPPTRISRNAPEANVEMRCGRERRAR